MSASVSVTASQEVAVRLPTGVYLSAGRPRRDPFSKWSPDEMRDFVLRLRADGDTVESAQLAIAAALQALELALMDATP